MKLVICTLDGKRTATCEGKRLCCRYCEHERGCASAYYCANAPERCGQAQTLEGRCSVATGRA